MRPACRSISTAPGAGWYIGLLSREPGDKGIDVADTRLDQPCTATPLPSPPNLDMWTGAPGAANIPAA